MEQGTQVQVPATNAKTQLEKTETSLKRLFCLFQGILKKIQIYNWQISSMKTKMTTKSNVGNLIIYSFKILEYESFNCVLLKI